MVELLSYRERPSDSRTYTEGPTCVCKASFPCLQVRQDTVSRRSICFRIPIKTVRWSSIGCSSCSRRRRLAGGRFLLTLTKPDGYKLIPTPKKLRHLFSILACSAASFTCPDWTSAITAVMSPELSMTAYEN